MKPRHDSTPCGGPSGTAAANFHSAERAQKRSEQPAEWTVQNDISASPDSPPAVSGCPDIDMPLSHPVPGPGDGDRLCAGGICETSRLQRSTAWYRTGLPTLHGPVVGQWASAPSCLRLTDGCADKKVDQSNRSGWDRQVAGPPCQMPEPSWASSFLDRSATEGPPIPGARLHRLADRGNLVQKRPRT